jgi:hypothetical protein
MKARKLSSELRKRIGIFKNKNPNATFREAADKFGVTYDQARTAVQMYNDGLLTQRMPRRVQRAAVKIANDKTFDEILTDEFRTCVAAMQADNNMPVETRVALLDRVTEIRRRVRAMNLEAHLKRGDADIIAAIVRRFEPDADDERVIAIYREEVELLKGAL